MSLKARNTTNGGIATLLRIWIFEFPVKCKASAILQVSFVGSTNFVQRKTKCFASATSSNEGCFEDDNTYTELLDEEIVK